MMTIIGTIENIENYIRPGYDKKIVTIVPDHRQKAFVEFRGLRKDLVNKFKEGDEIKVVVKLEGKTSKNSGIHYNNLVAQEVELVNYN